MSPRLARTTSRLLAMLFVGLLLARAGAAVAAAPEYIWVIVDDDTSLLLPNWGENQVLLLGERIEGTPERGRPRHELFLYWGSQWRTDSGNYGEVLAGNLSVATQRGYLYPAYRGQPALLVLEMPSGGSSVVMLSGSALALLEERGIPMSVSDEWSWIAGDGTMLAIGLGIIVIFIISASVIRFPSASRRLKRR